MKRRLKFLRFCFIVALLCYSSISLIAQHVIDGVIANNEYGNHADGFNKQGNMYMHWDNTNLYIGLTNCTLTEALVVYIDKNPLAIINGGTNSDGTNISFNYDGTKFSALNMRADFVAYARSNWKEYRTANGANSWSGLTNFVPANYAENAQNKVREFKIPWTALGYTAGNKPTSFAFFAYVTNSSGFVYNQVPVQNPYGNIGLSATVKGYYYVANTNTDKPFVSNSPTGDIGWANLQFPETLTLQKEINSDNIYAQVYKSGYTDQVGKSSGIEVWIGVHTGTAATNPSTWPETAWIPASYFKDIGNNNINNDEYVVNLVPSNLTPGTQYYYASRARIARTATYKYGGFNTGFWNGTTNKSGALTVNAYAPQTIDLNADNETPAVTIKPRFPNADQVVTISFDATLGNQALNNFGGAVYAHTGITTNDGSWKYGSNFEVDEPKYNITRDPSNANKYTWSMKIDNVTKTIREFYGVPVGTPINYLNFVMRSNNYVKYNDDGSVQDPHKVDFQAKTSHNSDFIIPVYPAGVQVRFNNVTDKICVRGGTILKIEAECNSSENIKLYVDGGLISPTTTVAVMDGSVRVGGKLNYNLPTSSVVGDHIIKVVATEGATSSEKTMVYNTYAFQTPIASNFAVGLKDGINYTSSTSATLVLYAPNKQFVNLLGDFPGGSWTDGRNFLLKRTLDNQRYWIELTGLTPGKEYAFQYLIDGSIRIADPYADKILDPLDTYIPAATYPGLVYPTGAANEIASVLQTNQTPYAWQVPNFAAPESNKLVIYELLIRDFTNNGTDIGDVKGVIEKLDYLKTLGVNAIEFLPFNEFEGNDSWGYNPNFYFAPDKAYGTKNDYKRLIDECHKRGMAVIMDLVLNHAKPSCPLVRMYYDKHLQKPTSNNPWFNEYIPAPCYGADGWGPDFNHEKAVTRDFVDRVNSYWLTEYKVDGMRFDFTKGFTNNGTNCGGNYDDSRITILKRMYNSIKATNSSAYVIFEHLVGGNEDKELANYGILMWSGKGLNTSYNQNIMGYNTNSNISGAYYQNWGFTYPNLISYAESHDEERNPYTALTWGAKSEDGSYNVKNKETYVYRTAAVEAFNLFFPGPRMLWQFEELAYDISIDYNDRCGRKPVKWDYFDDQSRADLYRKMAKMIQYRKQNPNIFQWKIDYYEVGSCKRIRYINPNNGNIDAVIIANFGTSDAGIQTGFGLLGKDWREIIQGITYTNQPSDNSWWLGRGDVKVFIRNELNPVYTKRAPFGFNITVSTAQNTSKTFVPADFKFYSVDNAIAGIKITSLPSKGTLRYNGAACTVNMFIPKANLGLLVYTPVTGGIGANYTSFKYKVKDDSGNAATEYSENDVTCTVDVVASKSAAIEASKTDKKVDVVNTVLSLFPNPSDGSNINMQVVSNYQRYVTVKIFDLYGKTVAVQQVSLNEGMNTTKLNSAKLSPGMYVVKIVELNIQEKLLIK